MCDGVWVQLQWSAVQVLLTAQQHAWLAAAVAATVVRRCRGWLCNPACLWTAAFGMLARLCSDHL